MSGLDALSEWHIAASFRAGDSIVYLVERYGVTVEQVKLAIEHFPGKANNDR